MASTDGTPAPRGRAPHRRDENARIAVLHAADDLLVERGFGGATIEGIAARAGVAKQMWLLALPLGTLAGAATARAAITRPRRS